MKKAATGICIVLFLFKTGFSQSFKKYEIGSSGCMAYFFCDPGKFQTSFSEDSSAVYTGSCTAADTEYGIICVKLKETVNDAANAEALLISYLDYLKTAFKIKSAVGYGKGHQLRKRPDCHGIIDYWEDESGNNLKVKGWTEGRHIVVLYVLSSKPLAETKVNLFLDGLVLPQ